VKKKEANLILVAILSLAFLLRVYNLDNLPRFGFNETFEEKTIFYEQAIRISELGFAPYFNPASTQLSLSYSSIFYFFYSNPVSVRLASLFANLVGLLFFYLFVREVDDEKTALVLLFFASVSPTFIFLNRPGILDTGVMVLFSSALLFFFAKFFKNDKNVFLFLCSIFLGVGFCLNLSFLIIGLPFTLLLIFYGLKKKMFKKVILFVLFALVLSSSLFYSLIEDYPKPYSSTQIVLRSFTTRFEQACNYWLSPVYGWSNYRYELSDFSFKGFYEAVLLLNLLPLLLFVLFLKNNAGTRLILFLLFSGLFFSGLTPLIRGNEYYPYFHLTCLFPVFNYVCFRVLAEKRFVYLAMALGLLNLFASFNLFFLRII